MVGGGSPWSRAGSMSFRLSNLLGSSSFGGTPHASQGDAVLGDNGGAAQPKKQLRFPLKAAITASVLATTGDTIAQLVDRYKRRKVLEEQQRVAEDVVGGLTIGNQATGQVNLWDHDWQRAARMASYGFLIYGPLSQLWYEVLDHLLPVKNLTNLSLKVVANQVILGPIVITLVFAWNKLWEGRLEQLPTLYRTRALQTLLDGWKFWIPASVLNFGMRHLLILFTNAPLIQELDVMQYGSATGPSGVYVILFHLLEFLPFKHHDCKQGKGATYEQVRIDHNPIVLRTTGGASIVPLVPDCVCWTKDCGSPLFSGFFSTLRV